MTVRRRPLAVIVLALAAVTAACHDERRLFREHAAASDRTLGQPVPGGLRPGPPVVEPGQERGGTERPVERAALDHPYEDNAWAVAEGKRLYTWHNCTGCHAHGGGGIGPALMDEGWRYGSRPRDIFASIVEGRRNGMPAFRGKLPEADVWKLVAYVRSLAGLGNRFAAPGRSDGLFVRPAESMLPERPPREENP
jgi:cytochrome c oxidase cbb3-type subunit III